MKILAIETPKVICPMPKSAKGRFLRGENRTNLLNKLKQTNQTIV